MMRRTTLERLLARETRELALMSKNDPARSRQLGRVEMLREVLNPLARPRGAA